MIFKRKSAKLPFNILKRKFYNNNLEISNLKLFPEGI